MPKTYRKTCKEALTIARIPREGLGREVFLEYMNCIGGAPIELRRRFDNYFLDRLVVWGELSSKSNYSLKRFIEAKYENTDFSEFEEVSNDESLSSEDRDFFETPKSAGVVSSIKREEYRSISDEIIGLASKSYGIKVNMTGLNYVIERLVDLQRPDFEMGACVFDEYADNSPQVAGNLRLKMDSIIIDSIIDRLGELNPTFSKFDLKNLKGAIIRTIKGRIVDSKRDQRVMGAFNEMKQGLYQIIFLTSVIGGIVALFFFVVGAVGSYASKSQDYKRSGTECRTFQERELRDAMRSQGLRAPCD